ncbi:unnamed protein product [Orchesella dallaii]|uniref:C2H2-type domain-containing protein n=1 Tax=Orchesella dallaii TaxID=48710 RepID=A0ABP1QEX7_9HEXA
MDSQDGVPVDEFKIPKDLVIVPEDARRRQQEEEMTVNILSLSPPLLLCEDLLDSVGEEVAGIDEENDSKGLNEITLGDMLSTSSEPCLICLASTTCCENEGSLPTLLGSDGNADLNQQLWALFVLQKLLKFPKRKCIEIFRKTYGVSNPGSWFALCVSCKETTKRAMEVCQKILKLEQHFKSFQLELEKRLQNSKEKVNGGGGVALSQEENELEENVLNIRLFIRDHIMDVKQSEIFVPKIEIGNIDTSSDKLAKDDDDYDEGTRADLNAAPSDNEDEEEVELSWLKNNNDADDPLYIPSRANTRINSKARRKGCGSFNCKLCPKRYTNNDDLKKHTKLHSTSKHICPICNFPSHWDLGRRIHLKNTHNVRAEKEIERYKRNGKYNCPDCPGIYRTARSFEAHRRNHERKGLTFACKICSYPCTTIAGLRKHIGGKHKDIHKCTSCTATFAFRSLLLKHKSQHKTEDSESAPMEQFQIDDDLDLDGILSVAQADQEQESLRDGDEDNEVQRPSGKKGHNLTCDQCGRKFTNSDAFIRHQRDHNVYKEYACPKCNYPCNSESALKAHLKRQTCQRKYEYNCDQCTYVTKLRYELDSHKQKHVVAASVCPPETSQGITVTKQKLQENQPIKNHQPTHPVNKKPYSRKKSKVKVPKMKKKSIESSKPSEVFVCTLCNRKYRSRISYANHRKYHELFKEFECTICHYPCNNAIALEGHMSNKLCNTRGSLNKPNDKEEYTCAACSFTTDRKREFNNHMNTHKKPKEPKIKTGDGRWKCRACDKAFTTLRWLTVHKREQHPELKLVRFKCDLCPKSYTKADALKDHISKAHLKQFNYYCEVCGRGTMKKSEHEQHMFKHQAVKSFVCEICGSAYTYQHGLTKHLNEYHNGNSSDSPPVKKFNCKFCDEKFSDRLQFNIHLKGAHKDLYVHKCDKCENTYLSVTSLLLHKKINHAEAASQAKCQFCDKEVASPIYLYNHFQKYCKKKPLGFQYSLPGVVSRRKQVLKAETYDQQEDS